ncbi:MAG: UDP-N-acetylmuramoyl-L-alanyl-D-glutamate--2,6-diaminopimelate ligase [Chloroflexi bacterium]|nr:UDP-N-acetylmuramoyl-L-alanyl-D-glutamate--2,6-diaminopimelate ligase [Chloroflexota bacterium]
MKLSDLLASLPGQPLSAGSPDPVINAIVSDSRRVQPGALFVAYEGVSLDGHRFIADALARGAVALVIEEKHRASLPAGVPVAVVPDGREALARLAAAWHGFPSRRMRIVGITGTDGKTTTSSILCAVLQTAGFETGLVSTVAAFIGEKAIDTGFHTTTPDAPDLQRYLAQMADLGAQYAVIESTSLGLAQKRLAAVEYDVAVVTNITHEHLNDHHNSFDEYRSAKRMMFEQMLSSERKPGVPKVAVLNRDDSSYEFLRAIRPDVQLSYGLHPAADVRGEAVRHSPAGVSFTAHLPSVGPLTIESPLIGNYNVYNMLAALAVGWSQGLAPDVIARGIKAVRQVPGRMERINRGQPYTVIVDFAHTPNALENALKTARGLTEGKVAVVFGCAGQRDVQKRPMMGEIAARLADRVVLTAEDPRTEPLDAILDQVAAGCEQAGGSYTRVPDRMEAIRFALSQAAPGDVVMITGKGHERSMCFGTTEYPWSDQDAVKQVLG